MTSWGREQDQLHLPGSRAPSCTGAPHRHQESAGGSLPDTPVIFIENKDTVPSLFYKLHKCVFLDCQPSEAELFGSQESPSRLHSALSGGGGPRTNGERTHTHADHTSVLRGHLLLALPSACLHLLSNYLLHLLRQRAKAALRNSHPSPQHETEPPPHTREHPGLTATHCSSERTGTGTEASV